MASTSTAKKTAKAGGPTWSKVSGGTARASKPASKAAPRKVTASKATGATRATRAKAPARKAKQSAPAFELPAHAQREIAALAILVIAALCMLGLFTWSSGRQGVVATAGAVLAQLFGVVAWLVPVSLMCAGVILLLGAKARARWTSLALPFGLALMLLSLMGFIHLFTSGQPAADAGQGGGYVGLAISTLLSNYLTRPGAAVVLFALSLAGFIVAFGISLGELARGVGRPLLTVGRFSGKALGEASAEISRLRQLREDRSSSGHQPVRLNGRTLLDDTAGTSILDATAAHPTFTNPGTNPGKRDLPDAGNLLSHSSPTEIVNLLGDGSEDADGAQKNGKARPEPVINQPKPKSGAAPATVSETQQPIVSPLGYVWNLPQLNLLETQGEAKVSPADIKVKIKVIEEALLSFKIDATVREVNTGPAVTQFAVEPGVGVRVNRITALDKDLALALAAPDIRIEAPIPGQSRIGIEVPNASLQVVGLRDIMDAEAFHAHKGKLKIAMGRDTHGQPVVTDLGKLPHILVAGATGSGKSVFLNSMVIGFLLQFTPDDLRMLMIDPKRVELTGFNGIPHLLRPVVTDVRLDKDQQAKGQPSKGKTEVDRERPLTAVEALKWALWEMERRYKHFAKGHRGKDGVSKVFRNIEQYRTFMKENPDTGMEHLPYIVIIIDELADLMLTAPEEVETSLCRLAQLAQRLPVHDRLAVAELARPRYGYPPGCCHSAPLG